MATKPSPTTCRAAKFCLRRFSAPTTTAATNSEAKSAATVNEASSSASPSSDYLLPKPPLLPAPPAPAPAHTSMAATTPPPTPPTHAAKIASPSLISRWLHLWDQTSGTHEILQLKENVNTSSTEFDAKQRQVARARAALDVAMETFEQSQLEHSRLLRSRDTWTSTQAYDFAKLLEKEIDIRKELESAKKTLVKLEAEQLASMNNYMNHLRRRYHEEQLWQDKWRVYSTYGTWVLLVFNSMVFLISQYMTRLRESQRMKDVRELVLQSIMVNEGTLRAIQEQQQQMQDRRQRKNEGKEERRMEDGPVTSKRYGNLDAAAVGDACNTATISANEAAALVSDEGDERKGKKHYSELVPSTSISLSCKLHNWWSSRYKYSRDIALPRKITFPSGESTTDSNKLVVATTPLSSQILQYWSNLHKSASGLKIPRKISLPPRGDDDDKIEVDVPSAILGASVAGIAWIIVNFVAPSQS